MEFYLQTNRFSLSAIRYPLKNRRCNGLFGLCDSLVGVDDNEPTPIPPGQFQIPFPYPLMKLYRFQFETFLTRSQSTIDP